jgi:hypothetical protein
VSVDWLDWTHEVSVNTVIGLRVPKITRNFLTSRGTMNFLRNCSVLLLFIPLSLRTEHRATTVPRRPRLLFQFLGSIRHLVGLLGGAISPTQGLYLHRTTQHRETQTHIHAPNRIRTCDPNVRSAEDST